MTKMICPYIVTRMTVRQWTSDHNDDGVEVSGEVIEYNEAIPFACAEKGCAAWHDGRCQYRGE